MTVASSEKLERKADGFGGGRLQPPANPVAATIPIINSLPPTCNTRHSPVVQYVASMFACLRPTVLIQRELDKRLTLLSNFRQHAHGQVPGKPYLTLGIAGAGLLSWGYGVFP